MRARLRIRFWAEALIGGLAAGLALLTLFSREWIEAIFGVDPDHGDGSLEWLIVGLLAVIACVLAVRARIDWRGMHPVET